MELQTSLIFLSASALSMLIYLSYVVLTWGIQPSISESYYRWPKNINFIFTLALWFFAIPIIIVATNGFLFFAGTFICVVGASQNFHEPFTGKTHVISAGLGIGLGMIALIINYNNWVSPSIFGLIALVMYLLKIKNLTWWAEIAALICIEISLFRYFLTI